MVLPVAFALDRLLFFFLLFFLFHSSLAQGTMLLGPGLSFADVDQDFVVFCR